MDSRWFRTGPDHNDIARIGVSAWVALWFHIFGGVGALVVVLVVPILGLPACVSLDPTRTRMAQDSEAPPPEPEELEFDIEIIEPLPPPVEIAEVVEPDEAPLAPSGLAIVGPEEVAPGGAVAEPIAAGGQNKSALIESELAAIDVQMLAALNTADSDGVLAQMALDGSSIPIGALDGAVGKGLVMGDPAHGAAGRGELGGLAALQMGGGHGGLASVGQGTGPKVGVLMKSSGPPPGEARIAAIDAPEGFPAGALRSTLRPRLRQIGKCIEDRTPEGLDERVVVQLTLDGGRVADVTHVPPDPEHPEEGFHPGAVGCATRHLRGVSVDDPDAPDDEDRVVTVTLALIHRTAPAETPPAAPSEPSAP